MEIITISAPKGLVIIVCLHDIFTSIHTNHIISIQILIVELFTRAFHTSGMDAEMWLWCLFFWILGAYLGTDCLFYSQVMDPNVCQMWSNWHSKDKTCQVDQRNLSCFSTGMLYFGLLLLSANHAS